MVMDELTERRTLKILLDCYTREDWSLLQNLFPMLPIGTPGTAKPGPDFVTRAKQLVVADLTKRGLLESGDESKLPIYLDFLYRRALYDRNFVLPVAVKHLTCNANVVPGHQLQDGVEPWDGGPKKAKVLVLMKTPLLEDTKLKRYFDNELSLCLLESAMKLGFSEEEIGEWYVTGLCKWSAQTKQTDAVPQSHMRDCRFLLDAEFAIVQPDFVLCLGSEPGKALLGSSGSVSAAVGRTLNYEYTIDAAGNTKSATVVVCNSPVLAFKKTEVLPDLEAQLRLFYRVTRNSVNIGREPGIKHVNVYKERHLKQIVDGILADPDPQVNIQAWDAEWQGSHFSEPGSYLRTIQFSVRHKEAFTVVLKYQGGANAFYPSQEAAFTQLQRLLDGTETYEPRVGGHFLRADLKFLEAAGLRMRDKYAPAETPELMRHKGGWDTSHMVHAHNETALLGLTENVARWTTAPIYDVVLNEHKADYCAARGITSAALDGYGFVPSWVLHPEIYDPEGDMHYAGYDADVTRRIAVAFMAEDGPLDKDWFGEPCWEPYWKTHTASLGVLQMEEAGIELDNRRVDVLTLSFMTVANQLLQHLREQINWPEFNPDSVQHCRAFLFGDEFAGKIDPVTKRPMRVRPEGAECLGLTPIKSTGKRPEMWEKIVAKGRVEEVAPSTDKESLGILGYQNKLAMLLRDIKFVNQVTKGALRKPVSNYSETGYERDDDGDLLYEDGVPGALCSDGRVRTHISQNKETGRYATARPNLQAISKRREEDYKRICGHIEYKSDGSQELKGAYAEVLQNAYYQYPIRSIFTCPDDSVLVEADFIGAELAAIGWLSGDTNLIDRVRRNSLPPDHPDYYEIHSQAAVRCFRLDCVPTKKGLESIGKKSLRIAAKNVMFGIPYQRQALAIARQCREEGVDITVEECEKLIGLYFQDYPLVGRFLEECKSRTQNPRWLAGAFGRKRRFIHSIDSAVVGEQERQGCNFPVQNLVADALSTAIHNFWRYQQQNPDCGFKMLLPVHDALLFEVKINRLENFIVNKTDEKGQVTRGVLYQCLTDGVPIWPRSLSNHRLNVAEPYHFGVDVEIQKNWGESLSKEQAEQLEISHLLEG